MTQPAGKPLYFTGVALQNWRNFSRIEVNLERRVFLVGPNASGKSNFLDLFRFLHDLVSVGGGFQEAVRRRGGVSSIRSLSARRNPEIALRARLGENGEERAWEYELAFTHDKRQRAIVRTERVLHLGRLLLERPNEQDRSDPERLTQTYLEQVNVNEAFRKIAEVLGSVRYLHLVPQLVREPERSTGRVNDPYGGDFLDQLARTNERSRTARLKQIRDALRVAVPQLDGLDLSRDARGIPHLRSKYEHWRPQGAWQSEDQFSDGTLRLFGLLWAVLDGSGPLLLEEPELSLHPDVVRYIPQMFARIQRRTGRQIIVSTHSTEILQDDGIGLDEVFLLTPGPEGTSISPAGDSEQIRALLQGGSTMAEAVMPQTRPSLAHQLALFGE